MTTTPADLADLAEKLATTSKTLADADKVRAESDKVRADAEKVRADSDKVRADAEQDARLAQNKLDVAGADLETKRIANDKARWEAQSAKTDKLIEQISGAVPDLSSVAKSSVTFGEGKALRQGEMTGLAVAQVAKEIGKTVKEAVGGLDGEGTSVFVVSDVRVVTALAGYWQTTSEADLLHTELAQAIKNAEEARERVGEPRARSLTGEAVLVAGAAIGKAATEVASLFELDVDVRTSDTDVAATSVQAAVIEQLLQGKDKVRVKHQWARVIDESSALLTLVKNLVALDIRAFTVDAELDAAIKTLGDPAADLAKAEKDAVDPKKTKDEHAAAEEAAESARTDLSRLNAFQTLRTRLAAVVEKAHAFALRITTTPTGATGAQDSPLAVALSVEPLTTDKAALVLVVGGGKAETHQMVVKRRILAPTVQTSTSVEVDYFLVQGDSVLAAGHAQASSSVHGRIKGSGSTWTENAAMRG